LGSLNLKREFKNVYNVIKIRLSLPTSSCSVERPFSKLKIIKSKLRSTMGKKRSGKSHDYFM